MRSRSTWALLFLFPAVAAADGGGSVVVGAPRGALGEQASVAGGLAGHAVFPSASPVLSLRLEGSWLLYGTETVRVPLARTAGRINREITTDNWIAQLGIGPQLVLPLRAVRPYVHGFAGVSYLSTTSQLRDPDGFVSATSTNYDDTAFAYGGGGGLLVPLRGRGTSLDLGVRYVRTGSVRFLGEGDLVSADGGVRAVPHRGHADMLEFRVGLAFGQRPR
ncbi:MAG: hypothetical protein DMF78_18025 [Acidobacteria bacterium]|nr:MAG: hypothetical protein DMF78_18025 [Acidobacteriota bacterium]